MHLILVIALAACLIGCSTSPLPKQPEAPTDGTSIKQIGQDADTRASKVAAAVTVAVENKDKPAVVEAEGKVALSALPRPTEAELAIARLRVLRQNPQDYVSAAEQGKAILARIQGNLDKALAEQKEAKRVSDLKDKRIAELEQKLADSDNLIWTVSGIALCVIGGLIWWLIKDAKGAMTITGVGLIVGAFPRVADSPWFMWIAIGSLGSCAVLGVLWLADKVRDDMNDNPRKNAEIDPAQSSHDDEQAPPQV